MPSCREVLQYVISVLGYLNYCSRRSEGLELRVHPLLIALLFELTMFFLRRYFMCRQVISEIEIKMFTSKAVQGAQYILAQVELFLIDFFHEQLNNPILHSSSGLKSTINTHSLA
jgi:hypothetical protein